MSKVIYNASDLTRLLAAKHHGDVFVPQCKNGSTWFSSHLQLDAWAMNRSWKNMTTWGYEIKVSRSDFVNDTKWRGYLPYCAQFYFVAPPSLIDPRELPDEAGLLVCSVNCKRLYTKKKAPEREVNIPPELYQYILMSRSTIFGREYERTIEDGEPMGSSDYWRTWLAQRSEDQGLGWRVARRIRQIVDDAQRDVRIAEKKVEFYEAFREQLRTFGFDPDAPMDTWLLKRQLSQLQEVIPHSLMRQIVLARKILQKLEQNIEIITAASQQEWK